MSNIQYYKVYMPAKDKKEELQTYHDIENLFQSYGNGLVLEDLGSSKIIFFEPYTKNNLNSFNKKISGCKFKKFSLAELVKNY